MIPALTVMHGNICEWDWYDYTDNYYGSSTDKDTEGMVSGSYRILRGDSWYYSSARSAFRYCNGYCFSNADLGFRFVLPGNRKPAELVS